MVSATRGRGLHEHGLLIVPAAEREDLLYQVLRPLARLEYLLQVVMNTAPFRDIIEGAAPRFQ